MLARALRGIQVLAGLCRYLGMHFAPSGSITTGARPGRSWNSLALILAFSGVVTACGGGGSAGQTPAAPPVPVSLNNTMPVAAVGASQTVRVGATVTLDGRGSSDADGDVLQYRWTIASPTGDTASPAGADTPSPSFKAAFAGDYVARLVVSDGKVESHAATLVVRSRRDYARPSYELAQPDRWYSSEDLRGTDGAVGITGNPLLQMQTVQVDLDGDGVEDIFSFDSYPLDAPLPNPPPRVYLSRGASLVQAPWTGAAMRQPHGVKILVGDFNADGYPDLFSLVAIDPPFNMFPDLQDFNALLWGSPTGFNSLTEFDAYRGFWYAGASGDIDGDGALDIVMFNFHHQANGVRSQTLWNDGRGGFRADPSGIGEIPGVDQAELVDVNGDGHLDLVIDAVANGVRTLSVLWGDGRGFSPTRAASFNMELSRFVGSINFADLDGDGFQELILSGVDDKGVYWIQLLQSDDRGKSFIDRTSRYFEVSQIGRRFDRLHLADIDRNGRLDLFAPDRRDAIRWQWDGQRFVLQP